MKDIDLILEILDYKNIKPAKTPLFILLEPQRQKDREQYQAQKQKQTNPELTLDKLKPAPPHTFEPNQKLKDTLHMLFFPRI